MPRTSRISVTTSAAVEAMIDLVERGAARGRASGAGLRDEEHMHE